jgi:hypothetical protein
MKNIFLKGAFIVIMSSMIINDCISCPTQFNIAIDYDTYYLPIGYWDPFPVVANATDSVEWVGGNGFNWVWDSNGLLDNDGIGNDETSSWFWVYSPSSNPGTYLLSVKAWDPNHTEASDSTNIVAF